MANITGSWLGTYWQLGIPTRFEATFVQGGNTLSGSILDDGDLGEARIYGEIIGRSISFTKQYLNKSNYSIQYTGNLSESEDFIHGEWLIGLLQSGAWEAHRKQENLMDSLYKRIAAQKDLVGVS